MQMRPSTESLESEERSDKSRFAGLTCEDFAAPYQSLTNGRSWPRLCENARSARSGILTTSQVGRGLSEMVKWSKTLAFTCGGSRLGYSAHLYTGRMSPGFIGSASHVTATGSASGFAFVQFHATILLVGSRDNAGSQR